MLLRRTFLAHLGLQTAALATRLSAAPREGRSRQLLTCGRERVHLLDLDQRDSRGQPRIVWTWQAAGRTDLPREYPPLFRSTDECKPVDGGRRILITSSSGAVGLVERATGAVVFHGRAANAHSADVLPRGRIAVAASRDPRNQQGDALILFDVATSGRELWRTELPAGHGVVWDEQRQLLWALADADLRVYQLANWDSRSPTLTRVALIPLPEDGGHDLFPVPGTPFLSVTTANRCWLFDRDQRTLQPHPALALESSIKCISQHPATGQLAYVKADRPNWWSTTIRFLAPADTTTVEGEQFYKVRWFSSSA